MRPWNSHHGEGPAIGKVWFERSNQNARESTLLRKMLFTKKPLSLQVHPNDAYAQLIGLLHAKCEAWYVLSAPPDPRLRWD